MAKETEPLDRLTVTRGLHGPDRVTIYWEQEQGTEGWTAHRMIPSRPHTRMRDFDCDDMLSVFKLIRDILAGKIDESILTGK